MTADVHLLKQPVTDDDWSRGAVEAPVVLVEYADFQCSHCQAAHPTIERLMASFGDRVRFVFRHFPVASIHPQADQAALAAEAAGRQGKFWEMHRRLFEARGALSEAHLLGYARELGIDTARFRADMGDPELHAKVRQQKMLGVRSGVNGTPTLYLNAARYDGPALSDSSPIASAKGEAEGPSPSAGETELRDEIERLLRGREVRGQME